MKIVAKRLGIVSGLIAIVLGFVVLNTACTKKGASTTIAKPVAYHKNVTGYLAQPKGNNKYPALILIHEWWGLNDNIRTYAEKFAKEGYVVLAVDLYEGRSTTSPDIARQFAGHVSENKSKAFANLKSAVAYLKQHPNVQSNRLASVGWCFGGGWSYQIAKNDLGVKASVIYYGAFNPSDDLTKMKAAIQGHFAEKDTYIKVDSVREFQAKLNTLNGDHEIFIYPNTHHGFANSDNKIYDADATQKAWERTVQFLKKIV